MSVYIIGVERSGPVKIGIASSVGQRVRGLQTGNSDQLTVFHIVSVDDNESRLIEQLSHKALAHARMKGEWFDASVSQAHDVVSSVALSVGVTTREQFGSFMHYILSVGHDTDRNADLLELRTTIISDGNFPYGGDIISISRYFKKRFKGEGGTCDRVSNSLRMAWDRYAEITGEKEYLHYAMEEFNSNLTLIHARGGARRCST